MSELKNVSVHAPSPEQQKVIDTWGQGLAVMAGAGSGKTTTLVTKCLELLKRQPDARFAAVSFTERSTSDLRAKLAEKFTQADNPGAIHHHWVMTIHGLCGAVIQEFPREAGLDGEEQVLSESESLLLWESALDSLWLDELPDPVAEALNSLLDRESQQGLSDLLRRVRELMAFGVLDSLKQKLDPSSLALAQVSEFVLEKYARIKRRRGALDFNDLEICADRALNSPRVQEIFHRRFHLVLVDEFQDTNPLQARLIWKLAQPSGANLCVVGDPKQSIYRFRDADVTVFEEFCARLPIRQSLTWNFRSRPGIIHFSNEICAPAFEASQMRFEALVPQREVRSNLEPVVKVRVKSPAELAQWILNENQKGVPLDEMALLVRRIRGNEAWFKALSANGIPLAFGSGGLFWDDPRVRELVAFLKWWDHPFNSLSGAIFLRAPWMEISDEVLDRWVKEDATFTSPFFSSHHPIALRLNPWRGSPVRPGELLMSLLLDETRENELWAPLMGLWHRVEEYSAQGLEFHEVVQELSRAVEEKRRDREVPAPRQLGQLSVLTFHGAKGLEFPHVILIDFPLKPRSSDAPLLFWDREDGAFLGGRDEDGNRDRKNPVEVQWRGLEKKKNLAESKRVFYVALTRARERLILACQESEGEGEPDRATLFLEDHWRNWVEYSGVQPPEVLAVSTSIVEVPIEPQTSPSVNTPTPQLLTFNPARVQKKRARHSVTEWSLLAQCPRAYEWTFIRPQPVIENPAEKPGQTRQDLGTRVHQCLQYSKFSELRVIEAEVGSDRLNAEALIRWAEKAPSMMPENPVLGREVWKEMAFEVPILNEILVGSLDRLSSETQGNQSQYAIVDFKVGQSPKSPRMIIQSYSTQIQLYALAVKILGSGSERKMDRVQASVVHISPRGVQEVMIPIDLRNCMSLAQSFVSLSAEIISGVQGEARPGGHCNVCRHQKRCPASIVTPEPELEQMALF